MKFYENLLILDWNDLEKLLSLCLGSFPNDFEKPFEVLCDRFLGRSVPIIWRRFHLRFDSVLRLRNNNQCRLLLHRFELNILAHCGKKHLIIFN